MEISEFNEVNEALKRVMSEYQTSSRFLKEEFINLHNKLIKLLDNEMFYEDFKIGFLNAFNGIINNLNKSYLIEDKNSYHNMLWKLHAVIVKDKIEKKSINADYLPEELKVFNEYLPGRQKIFKENNIYNVVTLLGEAQGHISSIKKEQKKRMKLYNVMTCGGFDKGFLGGCGMAWMGLVILFFIAALLRKWGSEEIDVPYNFITSLIAGFLGYIIVITFTGSPKWSMLFGIIAILIGGYATPYMYEEPSFGG